MGFSDRINEAISEAGVKPVEVADAADITEATMSAWRHGNPKKPAADNVLKACKFLRINIEWLIFGKKPMSITDNHALVIEKHLKPQHEKLLKLFEKLPPHEQSLLTERMEEQVAHYDDLYSAMKKQREE
jgi:transcriptional regulator with XRE-family HTH domain